LRHQFARLGTEPIDIGIEQIGSEPVHHQPRRCHTTRFQSAHLPMAISCLRFDRSRRLVAVTHVLKQRQYQGEYDAVLYAQKDHGNRSCNRKSPLAGAFEVEIA